MFPWSSFLQRSAAIGHINAMQSTERGSTNGSWANRGVGCIWSVGRWSCSAARQTLSLRSALRGALGSIALGSRGGAQRLDLPVHLGRLVLFARHAEELGAAFGREQFHGLARAFRPPRNVLELEGVDAFLGESGVRVCKLAEQKAKAGRRWGGRRGGRGRGRGRQAGPACSCHSLYSQLLLPEPTTLPPSSLPAASTLTRASCTRSSP